MEESRVDAERVARVEVMLEVVIKTLNDVNDKLDNNVVTRREFDDYKASQEKNSFKQWLPNIISIVSVGIAAYALWGGK